MQSGNNTVISPDIVQAILGQLQAGGKVWVGYSGGLDSTVLLHALYHELAAKNAQHALAAIHIHHGLSPNADAWAQHCQDYAAKLGICCHVHRMQIASNGKGLEAAARQARYDVFAQYLKSDDVLLLAHHAHDQAETLLFRLARGTGLDGLSGIPSERIVGKGVLLRPLLNVCHSVLSDYASVHALPFIVDESNHDERFDRNFLRQRVLPVLSERWPSITSSLAKTASLLHDSRRLLHDYANEDLQRCHRRKERIGESIDLSVLLSFSSERRQHILRSWMTALHITVPSVKQLNEVQAICVARVDATPQLIWAGHVLQRFQGRIYIYPELQAHTPYDYCWDGSAPLLLGDGSVLTLTLSTAAKGQGFSVVSQISGIRCRPRSRRHSQTLKKLLLEYKLEPWLRARVPLIYSADKKLLAVGDVFVCDPANELGIESVCWSFDPHYD